MATYISILRGINVSGHNMIKMDALKKMYADLDFQSIQTYIQSGNVIFQTKVSKPSELEERISKKIKNVFGLYLPVLVKELNDIKEIVKRNPFIGRKDKNQAFLHITFLSFIPDKIEIQQIESKQYAPDEFVIIDSAVYLYCPNGYGKTKLTNTFFEKKLNVSATTRNWKTVNELLKIAEKML